MAHVRFTDVQDHPTEFRDFTRLTRDEFPLLVPPFEAAFHAHRREWRLDGNPRTARQFPVYQPCPLPPPDERRFFLLTSLKTDALQGVQGRRVGMRPRKAKQWLPVLLPMLLTALRPLGAASARSLSALAQRLGVSEAAAATVVAPLEEEPAPLIAAPGVAAPDAPLAPRTARHIVRPQDPAAQNESARGTHRDHTVKNGL